MEIINQVIQILAEVLEVSANEIVPGDDIRHELGADSMDLVSINILIENRFNLTISDQEIKHLKTPASIAGYIEALMIKKETN